MKDGSIEWRNQEFWEKLLYNKMQVRQKRETNGKRRTKDEFTTAAPCCRCAPVLLMIQQLRLPAARNLQPHQPLAPACCCCCCSAALHTITTPFLSQDARRLSSELHATPSTGAVCPTRAATSCGGTPLRLMSTRCTARAGGARGGRGGGGGGGDSRQMQRRAQGAAPGRAQRHGTPPCLAPASPGPAHPSSPRCRRAAARAAPSAAARVCAERDVQPALSQSVGRRSSGGASRSSCQLQAASYHLPAAAHLCFAPALPAHPTFSCRRLSTTSPLDWASSTAGPRASALCAVYSRLAGSWYRPRGTSTAPEPTAARQAAPPRAIGPAASSARATRWPANWGGGGGGEGEGGVQAAARKGGDGATCRHAAAGSNRAVWFQWRL